VAPSHTHYFSENLVAPGIEPESSGSVARNCDHKTTEAVHKMKLCKEMLKNWIYNVTQNVSCFELRNIYTDYEGFEVLIAIVMKSSIFWNIIPCS
jgi:hypothetical protein